METIHHIAARTHDRQVFSVPLSLLWQWCIEELRRAHLLHNLRPHAFVLMGNHFHLLAAAPEGRWERIMQEVLNRLEVRMGLFHATSAPLWEEQEVASSIVAPEHYLRAYRYVLQNPLRSGFVDKIEDWPFSTASSRDPLPLFSSIMWRFGGDLGERNWLNQEA